MQEFSGGILRQRLANRIALSDQDIEEQLEKLRLVDAKTSKVKMWNL